VRVWSSGIAFVFSGFVLGTILQEFWRGAVIRRKSTGTDLFTATIGLVGRSRRRYGGYIVHVGIVLMCLGFAGQGFKQSTEVALKPGQQTVLGSYTIRMDALKVTTDDQKQMITGFFTVFEGGREIAKMYPARWFFNKHEEPTTEVAIRRKFHEDLYVNMATFQVKEQAANLEIVINPLVNWIWFGFAVMALGTGIVLLPERTFAFAMAKFPAPEVATTAGMFLLMLCLAAPALAQHTDATPGALVTSSPLEKEIQRGLICLCGDGGCGKKIVSECTCSVAAETRAEIAGLVAQGKTKDEVFAYYVAKYGSQEVLGAPIDRGFNRLAWLFPYAAALSIAVFGAFAVRKWSRHPHEEPAPRQTVAPAEDAALQARLDQELDNLN